LVERWIEGMRDWLAGDEQWARESGRYFGPTPREAALLAQGTHIARGPPGLGTSAPRRTPPPRGPPRSGPPAPPTGKPAGPDRPDPGTRDARCKPVTSPDAVAS